MRCAVITVSDTRTEETDGSGRHIREALAADGHEVVMYRIVKDDAGQIRAAIEEAAGFGESKAGVGDGEGAGAGAGEPRIRAILLNGGTGIGSRDGTYEVVAGMIEKRLDGFGEIFRMLSYEEVGAAAMLSRALAGSYRGTIVISMPGSTGAVRLAMDRLILPELGHLVREVSR